MNVLSHVRARPWLMAAVLIGFLSGHALALHFLWHSGKWHFGLPGILATGVIVVIVLKHLGMLAVLLRPLRERFRRWFRS